MGTLGRWLDPVKEPEFLQFLDAYSEMSGVPFGQIYFLNYLYEDLHFCSGVIVKTGDGQIL